MLPINFCICVAKKGPANLRSSEFRLVAQISFSLFLTSDV